MSQRQRFPLNEGVRTRRHPSDARRSLRSAPEQRSRGRVVRDAAYYPGFRMSVCVGVSIDEDVREVVAYISAVSNGARYDQAALEAVANGTKLREDEARRYPLVERLLREGYIYRR